MLFDDSADISGLKAYRPWNSPYVLYNALPDISTNDSAEMIEMCMHCPYDTCINCHSYNGMRKQQQKKMRSLKIDKLQQLLTLKKSPTSICLELNISRRTFYKYKKLIDSKNTIVIHIS